MDKDLDFYRRLDLAACASRIPGDRPSRLRAEALSEVIKGIIAQCNQRVITADALRQLLGQPDRTRQGAGAEVWEYDWIGWHCSREYAGSTPFLLQGARVVGVERD